MTHAPNNADEQKTLKASELHLALLSWKVDDITLIELKHLLAVDKQAAIDAAVLAAQVSEIQKVISKHDHISKQLEWQLEDRIKQLKAAQEHKEG